MEATTPASCYENTAQCDICAAAIPAHQTMWHCSMGRSLSHQLGYDFCTACANKMAKLCCSTCGGQMEQTTPQECYGDSHGATCDRCGLPVMSTQAVWHCSRGRSKAHSGGFDFCLLCGHIQTLEGNVEAGVLLARLRLLQSQLVASVLVDSKSEQTPAQQIDDQKLQEESESQEKQHDNQKLILHQSLAASHSFRQFWTGAKSRNGNSGYDLQDVPQHSNEWITICSEMKSTMQDRVFTMQKIQRVENNELWVSYSRYRQQVGTALVEMRTWHGSRACDPQRICETGFDMKFAKVGDCLWYAVHASYSTCGYQHQLANGSLQIFLVLVAYGTADVKLIRDNSILNVYKNEATYPAYLLTYK